MKKILLVMLSVLVAQMLVACNDTNTGAHEEPANTEDLASIESAEANYNWDEILVNSILPEPVSKNAKIFNNEEDYLDITVFDTSLDEYNEYIASCEDNGFEVYTYENSENNELISEGYNKYYTEFYITYDVERESMNIILSALVENNPLQWSNSALAQLIPIPENTMGYIDADKEEKYEVILMDVSLSDFNNYVDACIESGFTMDAERYSTEYEAYNEDGCRLLIEFGEMDRMMGIGVFSPEHE